MLRRIHLLLPILLITGCGNAKTVNSCNTRPAWPDEYVMDYMEKAPNGVQRWYGSVITTMCTLDGGTDCGGITK